MENRPPTLPPRSAARPVRAGRGLADRLRDYDDDPRLDHIWQRIDRRPRERRSSSTVAIALVAAVSLSVGFVGGRSKLGTALWDDLVGPTSHRAPTAEVLPEARPRLERPSSEPSAPAPPRERALTPTRTARVSPPRGATRATDPALRTEVLVEEAPVDAEQAPTPVLQRVSAPWAALAERGDYAAAFRVLDESGELANVVGQGSSEELMTLADVARFAGRNAWAIQALREVTTRFEADENAPIAAMMLGNLLSRAGDAEGAARAYALNRRLSPRGDFADDALLREFGVACKAGDRMRAEALFEEYAQKFPTSEGLEAMRDALAELKSVSEALPDEGEELGDDALGPDEDRGAGSPDRAPEAPRH